MSVHDPYQCPWQWSHRDSLIRRVCVQFIHTADISGWTLWGSAESLFQSTLGKKTCKEGSQHWLKRSVDFATFVQSDHQPCRRPWSSDGPLDSPQRRGCGMTDIHDPIQPKPWERGTPPWREVTLDQANWPCMEGGGCILLGQFPAKGQQVGPSTAVLLVSGKWVPLSCGD